MLAASHLQHRGGGGVLVEGVVLHGPDSKKGTETGVCKQMQRAARMLLHRQLFMAWNAFKDHARLAVLQRQAMSMWSNKALYEVLYAFRYAATSMPTSQ